MVVEFVSKIPIMKNPVVIMMKAYKMLITAAIRI